MANAMTKRLKPSAVAKQIVGALTSRRDARAAAQGQTYFKEPVRLLGVRTPDMRRLARETYAQLKLDWHLADAVALCELLLPNAFFEPRAVALLVCERFQESFDGGLLPIVRRWLEAGYCDSWGMVDCLCAAVLAPLLGREPKLIAQTKRWTSSQNRWMRRAAAVSLVPLARRGHELDQAYAVARRLLDDGDDLVRKATGWLLREAGKTDRDRLRAFLGTYGPKFSRMTFRYAIEHFPQEQRKRLSKRSKSV